MGGVRRIERASIAMPILVNNEEMKKTHMLFRT
jgi:hypothetical protein